MDSLITSAARALAAGDPLGVLNLVALRDDPPALALRGIAMARLGDLVRAKVLFRSAARAPSVRKRPWPARGASSRRPRSRGYVTDEQRSSRPIFNATFRAAASWLFFRVARSTRARL